jgi:hypothetical protein
MPTDPKRHALDRLDAACRANDRKGGGTPDAVKKIGKTERLLREAIRRTGLPPSLARQGARMVGHYAHKRLRGFQAVWPGMEKMAKWGECSERQARRNFVQLEAGEVIRRVGAEKGGRRLATEWTVQPGGLKRWLILIGANPSRTLLGLLDTILMGGAPHPEAHGENPDMEGEKPGHRSGQNPDMEEAEIDPKNPDTKPGHKPGHHVRP